MRDAKGDGAEAVGEGFGFITVCVDLACISTLVRLGLEDAVAQTFGEAVMARAR